MLLKSLRFKRWRQRWWRQQRKVENLPSALKNERSCGELKPTAIFTRWIPPQKMRWGAAAKGMIRYDGVVRGETSKMSDRAASCFGLCAFMRHINAHKIYRTGHDPTDKFYNFMCIYAHIKFIGAVRSFMWHLCFRINVHKIFYAPLCDFWEAPIII